MSPRARPPAPEAQDLANAPYLDDAERAESEWWLVRDGDPSAPAPLERIARDYEHLEGLLGSLPAGPPDERWHDEVLQAASALSIAQRAPRPRPVFQWALGGALLAAASVAAILLFLRSPELEVSIQHGSEARDAGEPVVGDRLMIEARPRDGAGDLRVFQADGTPVAKCPDGPGCRISSRGHYVLELTLEKPVQYQVILVVGDGAAVSRLPDGVMSAYLQAANAADVRIVMYRPIDVH